MTKRKRIGFLVGRVWKYYAQELLSGVLAEAQRRDMDVLVFTVLDENVWHPAHDQGERNILRLIDCNRLDGMLLAVDTFEQASLRTEVERFLCTSCTVPLVTIEIPCERSAANVIVNDCAAMDELVTHMITAHGCRKFLLFNGPLHHVQSRERQKGFLQALERFGIPFDTAKDVVEGDYWIHAAKRLGEALLAGERPFPDVIVCTSDMMALTLCDTLRAGGVRIPEQVAVTGFDGTQMAYDYVPRLTTYYRPSRDAGAEAMCRLYEIITGIPATPLPGTGGVLELGKSCGCDTAIPPRSELRQNAGYLYSKRDNDYLDRNISALVTEVSTLQEIVARLYAEVWLLPNAVYSLCLCEDWESDEFCRTDGYADTMFRLDATGKETFFQTKNLIPELDANREKPSVFYFTPVHFNERCFGYSVLQYEGIDFFDMLYRRWSRDISAGLEFLRVKNHLNRTHRAQYLSAIRDPLTGIFNATSAEGFLREYMEQAMEQTLPLLLLSASIMQLRSINDSFGHTAGNEIILVTANAMQSVCRSGEVCIRIGGNAFLVLGCADSTEQELEARKEALRAYVLDFNRGSGRSFQLSLAVSAMTVRVRPEYTPEVVLSMAQNALEAAVRQEDGHSDNAHYAELVRLRQTIYDQPQLEWNIDRMISDLFLSRSHFHNIYKQCFGVTCMQDVAAARIQCAKRLLLSTQSSLNAIAIEAGYGSATNFMRHFKKAAGMTPNQYRKENQTA